MTPQDIEAELSYAYLHAVASHAGIACQAATRTHDNLGIDAMLSRAADFGEGAVLTEVTLHIQLKATKKQPTRRSDGALSYFLNDVAQYNRLRADSALPPKLLGVLFLPQDANTWLTHSVDCLTLRRCAYWVSLAGLPPTTNDTGQTVYFPVQQELCGEGLLDLFRRMARLEDLRHGS